MKTIFADWNGHNVKLTWIPGMRLSESTKVTSVHAICLKDGMVLLTHIKNRGFNLPGGHVNFGEKLETALLREVYEEGYVKGTVRYIGAIRVSHEEDPAFDPKGKYPLIGYQAFYRMEVTECLPFLREYESITRIWVEPSEFPFVIDEHQLSGSILETAMMLNTE